MASRSFWALLAKRVSSPARLFRDIVGRASHCYRVPVPVYYQCQRCTACCRWPGQVKLTHAEVTRLAEFKGMSEYHFIQAFTRLREDRQGLALLEKNNGECIFLKGNDCSVQPVKPQQCRDFPNRWNFPGFQDLCHATAKLVSQVEYDRLIVELSPSASFEANGPALPSH